ncbi:hypothetical protein SISNIDRAFT_499612 [Sistotremastrum niveocremeum HHB9708]|uniref:High-temperature-induced dauer-formation protein n=1 Tax=Sistotremastrum niveocremeum HHB9708 TaxID=1314777 RepID=A0A165AG49_9AGAM|nr:hypothetical protein SISNIDRAFT_499612 [Sistotremastrum niveocremeum HHB9708]
MFALPKIPQKLSSPFGLLGDDAKLSFRTQPSGISKLADSPHISPDDPYWDQFTTLFDTPSDVFSLITPQDIRLALLQAPENVSTLVKVISSRLFTLVSDHTFPNVPNQSVVGSFMGSSSRNTTKEVLNCVRILSRIFPVIFELDTIDLELEIMWKREVDASASVREDNVAEAQFVIDDEDEDADSRPEPSTPSAKTKPPLAERLFNCIIDLLFCCGFTLPQKIQVDHYKINYVIWEHGVGSTTDPGTSQAIDINRAEVLRLLLVLLSRSIYLPPTSLLSVGAPCTAYLVQKTPRRHVLTLLCSLLNTAMNSAKPGFAIPYNHLVWKTEDTRATLVGLSLQVLCVVLDYQSNGSHDVEIGNGEKSPTAKTNAFRYFLAKLHRTADFDFIIDGLLGIFAQQLTAINLLLPGSRKPVPYLLETIVFFWKILELNKKFRAHLLQSDKSADVLAYLMCFSLDCKDKPRNHGLTRALSYMIQSLSGESGFANKLLLPVRIQIPPKWTVTGTTGDFMINAVYSVVATTSGQLNSLYPALIIALSNVAPYLKDLTVNSATRLVQLARAFSAPAFLLADEGHPRLLYFLLEIFNAIIQHHLAENPNVIYGILRSHQVFEDLGTFTLARGLREIRRIQLKTEQRRDDAEQKGKTKAPMEASAEKARLLESEGVELPSQSESMESLPRGRTARESHDTLPENIDSQNEEATPGSPPVQILASPAAENPVLSGPVNGMSEKARGKMRQRSMSGDITGSLERLAAAGVGRNGFVPTQEWVTSWQQGLPLDTIMLTIAELKPKIHRLQASVSKAKATTAALDFLRSANLIGVLEPAPSLNPRRFVWSDASLVWLSSLIWGEIYMRGISPLGIWNTTNVRLFHVKHTPSPPTRHVSEAMSTVVGGLGGLLGRGGGSPETGPNNRARGTR